MSFVGYFKQGIDNYFKTQKKTLKVKKRGKRIN